MTARTNETEARDVTKTEREDAIPRMTYRQAVEPHKKLANQVLEEMRWGPTTFVTHNHALEEALVGWPDASDRHELPMLVLAHVAGIPGLLERPKRMPDERLAEIIGAYFCEEIKKRRGFVLQEITPPYWDQWCFERLHDAMDRGVAG